MKIEEKTTQRFVEFIEYQIKWMIEEAAIVSEDENSEMWSPNQVHPWDYQREVAEAINSMARDMMDDKETN